MNKTYRIDNRNRLTATVVEGEGVSMLYWDDGVVSSLENSCLKSMINEGYLNVISDGPYSGLTESYMESLSSIDDTTRSNLLDQIKEFVAANVDYCININADGYTVYDGNSYREYNVKTDGDLATVISAIGLLKSYE